MFLAVFHDLKSATGLLVVKWEPVTGHITTVGAHTNDFPGVLATDREVPFSEVRLVKITNGKAEKHREVAATKGVLRQTDVIPAE